MKAWAAAAALAAAAGGVPSCTCRGEQKRELELSRARDAAPVVVVDQPAGSVPLSPEKEPNDAREQAAPLGVPGGIRGQLASAGDVDFYQLPAGAARTVVIRLRGPAADAGGADLVLTLYGADGKVVAQSDRGPPGALEALPDAPLPAGQACTVSVTQFVKKGAKKKKGEPVAPAAGGDQAAGGATYELTVEPVTSAPGEEVEPNDTPDRARDVLLSDEVTGYIGWTKDQDHWRLNLAGFAGGYVMDLSLEAVDGVALSLDILGGPKGKPLIARRAEKGRALRVRALLPEVGATAWVARVAGVRSNPEQPYRLKSTARQLADGDEAEPNDTEDRAMAIGPLAEGAQGDRRGFLDGGDVDLYRFQGAREPIRLTLSVQPPGGVDVSLRALRAGGAELARADAGKVGAREDLVDLLVPAGEAVVVAVGGTAAGDEADPYTLHWTARADTGGPPAGAPPTAPPVPSDPTDNPNEP